MFGCECGAVVWREIILCISGGAWGGGIRASAGAGGGGAAPAAAASPKSGGALKVILIVVGVFIGLGILGGMAVTFGLWRLSRSVNVNRSGQVSINTPGGKISVGPGAEVSEAELGRPLSPGAKREEGRLQPSPAEGTIATYIFKTTDT